MAFPTVPEMQPESFLHYSKPIQDIPADRSKAIAIKDLGETFKDTVESVDKTLGKHAEYLGQQLGEQEQNDFVQAAQATDSLTKPQDPNVPVPVKEGLDYIERNQTAYGQGKVRETEYYKNLYEKAKSLRAQWPSYRDHIDRGVEKATGITPNANKYIQSLLAEINERNSKQDQMFKEIRNKAISQAAEGYPGDTTGKSTMADNIQALDAGKIDHYELLRRMNRVNAIDYNKKVAESNLAVNNAGEKVGQSKALDIMSEHVPAATQGAINAAFANIGLTPEKLAEYDRRRLNGEDVSKIMDDTQWRNFIQDIERRKTQLSAQLDQEYHKPLIGRDGKPTGDNVYRLAGEKYNEFKKNGMALFEELKESISNKDFGRMHELSNAAKSVEDKTLYAALADRSENGNIYRALSLARRVGGEQFVPQFYTANPGVLPLPNETSLKALLGNALGNLNLAGIKGMSESLDAISKGEKVPSPAAVKGYINALPSAITSDGVPDANKINVLQHVFDPKEQGWLDKIEDDYVTPDNKIVDGKHAVFWRYSSPAVVKEVKRLSESNPQLWTKYQGWMEQTFARDVFGNDIDRLKEIQVEPGTKFVWHTPPGRQPYFSLSQNNLDNPPPDPRRFSPGAARKIYTDARLSHLEEVVWKLNTGIGAMYNVIGENTPEKMLEIFRERGVLDTSSGVSAAEHQLILSMKPRKIEGSGKQQDRHHEIFPRE